MMSLKRALRSARKRAGYGLDMDDIQGPYLIEGHGTDEERATSKTIAPRLEEHEGPITAGD